MTIKLIKFTDALLAETTESWITSADNIGIPSLDYEMVLAWAKSHLANQTDNSHAYGIFEDDDDAALAIVDIVYTQRPGPDVGWLKMLSIYLSPMLAPSEIESNTDRLLKVLDIYAEAIIGTINLTSDHKARVVKLYGRNDNLLRLLVALKERLSATLNDKCHIKMEGRWLVIAAH